MPSSRRHAGTDQRARRCRSRGAVTPCRQNLGPGGLHGRRGVRRAARSPHVEPAAPARSNGGGDWFADPWETDAAAHGSDATDALEAARGSGWRAGNGPRAGGRGRRPGGGQRRQDRVHVGPRRPQLCVRVRRHRTQARALLLRSAALAAAPPQLLLQPRDLGPADSERDSDSEAASSPPRRSKRRGISSPRSTAVPQDPPSPPASPPLEQQRVFAPLFACSVAQPTPSLQGATAALPP